MTDYKDEDERIEKWLDSLFENIDRFQKVNFITDDGLFMIGTDIRTNRPCIYNKKEREWQEIGIG